MNVFKYELKASRKSLILWSIGMIFMVFAGMSKYASMSSAGQSLNEFMDAVPKSIQTVLGMGSFDLSKATGFYGVLFLYLIVIATIHAVMLGANIIAKEERDQIAEFLYTKPMRRTDIIREKLLAAFANVVILNLVTFISSLLIVNYYSDGEQVTGDIALLMIGLFLVQVIFLSIGSAYAAMTKKPKKAAMQATVVLQITFILSIMIDLTDKINFLKYFTPFKYFDAKDVMLNAGGEGLSIVSILLSILISTILFVLTFKYFQKRDLMV